MLRSKRFNFFVAISVVAIGLLLFVNVGFVAVYHVSKMRWYQQQLDAKEGETTVTLRLTFEEFENGRVKEHEWKINGEMYDARSIEADSNGVTMIAVHDEHENKLLKILTAGFRHDGRGNNALRDWVKALFNVGLPESRFFILHVENFVVLFFPHRLVTPQLYSPAIERPPLV
jgi:hypothetical protein